MAMNKQTVNYDGLLMEDAGDSLLCTDDEAIIDWLSNYDYPRALLTQSGTNTVIFYRRGRPDLVMVTNEVASNGQGLAVRIWPDFIGRRLDLRLLDRPYTPANEIHHEAVWNHIELQIQRLAAHYHSLPPIYFWAAEQGEIKLHYRFG